MRAKGLPPRRWSWLQLLAVVACAAGEHERHLDVSESVPVGTRIGFIGDGSGDGGGPPYLIVPVPGSAVDTDLIADQSTGEIRTRVPLDRETRASYALVAIPLSGENVRVVVRVLDENDNAPAFPAPFMHVEFPENTARDTRRTLHPARDPDLGQYNTQRYAIVAGNANSAFRLSSHREKDGVLYLDLQVNGYLDREAAAAYRLVIEAYDGGVPPLKGTMTVNVTVLDANDNQPTFDRSRYYGTVPENATVATSVLRVSATDVDDGENGAVEYAISRRQSDREGYFAVDRRTGVISVNRPLDYETREVHELVVVAKDRGDQPLETTAFVTIRVDDVNDNQPDINVIFLSDDATPKISERAQPGEFVARISVHDPDSRQEYSDRVNVTLQGGDGRFGLTTQDNIIYLVIVALPLDRESRANYTLSVHATDAGSPPLHASKTFHLLVTDVNDNRPEFAAPVYWAAVSEAAEPGTSVVRVAATDRDDGENAAVTYEMERDPPPSSQWFRVDARTGVVTTRERMDCERDPEPTFVVLAVDNGRPHRLTGTATVHVTVHDLNDNEPIFDQSFYNVDVSEDRAIGSCILKVSASDPDCGVNSMVNFTLSDNSGPFSIKSATGELCLAKSLDYETRKLYEFPVVATDRGGLSTSAVIKVDVLDVNDNWPIFVPSEYNVSVAWTSGEQGPVVTVRAKDLDSGSFGVVSYYLISAKGPDSEDSDTSFRVDGNTGEIWAAQLPSGVYRLLVAARDGNGYEAVQVARVRIAVLAQDAANPYAVFVKSQYSFTVPEDAPVGTVIGTVTVSPNQSGLDDLDSVRYVIHTDESLEFVAIDPIKGAIRTTAVLDHESFESVLLNIKAYSVTNKYYGANTQVNIMVEDKNDNSPHFDSSSVRIAVPENVATGSAIYTAHANDPDSGANGEVRYELIASTQEPSYFQVDNNRGTISLIHGLDYETVHRLTVTVVARDSGAPSLSDNMTLVVDVQDINDNPPVFERPHYAATVPESLPVNSQIVQVTALDADSGNNARVTYRVSSGDGGGSLDVHPSTGWVHVKSPLDRETQDTYELTVVAVDNGSPGPLAATVVVVITVADVNDNDPEFDREERYEFYVEENRPAGTVFGGVFATDRDAGDNALVRYSLIPANSSFNINLYSGELSTKEPLDREIRAWHEVIVEARDQDGGVRGRSKRVKVKVTVTDVNDNAPVIVDPQQDVVAVREQQPPGVEVVTVKATDPDQGSNATLTYSILKGRDSDGNGEFFIDRITGVIRTKVSLDHEDKSMYRLSVAATDNGHPPKQTIRMLRVEVLDLNDNRPTFTSSSLVFQVREDAAVGSIAGRIACSEGTGAASAGRGQVKYTLRHHSDVNQQLVFDLDRSTGALIVAGRVDRETRSVYEMEVHALDTGASTNPQSSSVSVRVEVLDVNDNAPKWLEDPVTVTVAEDSAVGSVVYNFTATDADSEDNSELRYSTVQQGPADVFSLDPLTGMLTLVEPLDFEAVREYVMVVRATDQAVNVTERLFADVTARITVQDVNDNGPKIVSPVFAKLYVDGSARPGDRLCDVVAVDYDDGDNGRTVYTISGGNERGLFGIGYETGALVLARFPDTNAKKHSLNITVADQGTPAKYSHMTLEVAFTSGAAEKSVHFAQKTYATNVSEDAPVGSFVAKVTANSNDNRILYSIPDGVAENCFKVDKDRGIITLQNSIDRERTTRYVFPVYAMDEIKLSTDVVTVEVGVLDVNDYTPKFKHDSCHTIILPENQDPSIVRTVVAVDPDLGPNSEVVYSIVGGNNGNKFHLDPKTGDLTSKTLDREVQAKYQLQIAAQNRGSTTAGHCNLTIIVDDENDNNPNFEQSKYEAAILEDVLPGTSVLTAKAHDVDMGVNAMVTYSLSNQTENVFQINNKTGVITTIGNLDREQQPSYWLQVVARDGGKYNPRSSTTLVHIKILDINDNTPVFTKFPFTAEIPSHVQPGMDIVRISTIDKDEGSNADVLYSFKENQEIASRFRINPNTGVVTASSSLASDNGQVFHLEVMATDKGNPPQSSTGLLEIKIGENFDRIPVMRFKNSTYHVTIPENLEQHKDILEISAYRSDGRKQKVIYKLAPVNNENQLFYIEEETGVIRVSKSEDLDYETYKSGVHLVVIAKTDAPASVIMWGYTDVWVHLTDQNDNSPVFAQKEYTATVAEGNPKGAFVIKVTATDLDDNENSRLSYHLVDGNHDNAFVIDPTDSGIVKTNIVLDSEIREIYKLTVIATDEGTPQMTGMAIIKVIVIDINDNRPSFPPQNTINVKEGLEVGSVITTVVANDVDTYPTLTYSWASSVGLMDRKLFALDRYSGRVSLIGSLDYERTQSYRMGVVVSDTEHTALTELSIVVTDDNDNSPVFDRPYYTFIMTENIYGESSMQVVAKDLDFGLNGQIKYALVNEINGFRIDQQTGVITANRLNFDQKLLQKGIADLLVSAADLGIPSLSTVVAVRANINPVHSNMMRFAQNEFRVSVREDIVLGETFLKLLPSYSIDSSVQFNIIEGNDEKIFDLMSPTGELFVKRRLDRESHDIYSLKITDNVNSSYVYVHVIVEDANDNAPQFTTNIQQSLSLPENTPIGYSITKLTADDFDMPPNSDIFYEITSGNSNNYFNINKNTGEIYVKSMLDCDLDNSDHNIVVKAQDSAKSPDRPLATIKLLKIHLEDVNDNTPKFPVSEYLEFVGENEPIGALVFTAKATDADRGYYGQLNYSIASSASYSGADDSWKMFKIDPSSGLVTTNAVFDYETRSRYTFTIVTSDSGGETTKVRVKIEIEGKDEFAPQFVERTFKFMVNTIDLPVGYIIGHVSATDRDKGPEGRVVYHLTTQNAYFKVNRTTGAIAVKKKIDGNFDAVQDISLVVTASSGKQGSLTNVSVVEISFDPLSQPGLNLASSSGGQNGAGSPSSNNNSLVDWIIGVLSVVLLVALLMGGIMFYFHLKNKQHRNINKPELNGHQRTDNTYVDPGAFDTIPIRGVGNAQVVGQFAPPKYDEIPTYRNNSSNNSGAATTSDLSGSEKSGSSGRGSAEDDVEDEEIRMINERQNANELTEVTAARNTQEYLARLGIVDAQTVAPPHLPDDNRLQSSRRRRRPMENIDMYDEDEAADGDITNMIYAKLSDVGSERGGVGGGVGGGSEEDGVGGGNVGGSNSSNTVYSTGGSKVPPPQPSMVGSLSSIVHSEEELTGSYNWDYLLDWGPQYQPLAHVFNEIARLKDDANSVKSSNSGGAPSSTGGGSHSIKNASNKKIGSGIVPNNHGHQKSAPPPPPPLLTNMAPRALSSRQSVSSSHHHNHHHHHHHHQATPPILLVPRSPISHESNPGGFSQSVAMSPSFSPSLSPLANRSPSISPLHSSAASTSARQRHMTTETELRL